MMWYILLLLSCPKEDEGPISSKDVAECLKCGRELAKAANRRGNELVKSGINLDAYTPGILHFFSGDLPRDLKKASDVSKEILSATKLLQMKMPARYDIDIYIL